jgi:hypothetical protein
MARKTEVSSVNDGAVKPAKAPKGSRYASKKAYFARNANGAISKRNKARRLAAAERRKKYWATEAGQARKAAKVNTPAKIKAREEAKVARAARRRQRQLEEQKAAREQTLKTEKAS